MTDVKRCYDLHWSVDKCGENEVEPEPDALVYNVTTDCD
jgi:hypothetical protein